MAKKGRLVFNETELAYGKKYGIMPDYHHVQLLEKGVHPDVASYLISTRMRLLYNQLKYDHEHPEETMHREMMKDLDASAFHSVSDGVYIPF